MKIYVTYLKIETKKGTPHLQIKKFTKVYQMNIMPRGGHHIYFDIKIIIDDCLFRQEDRTKTHVNNKLSEYAISPVNTTMTS